MESGPQLVEMYLELPWISQHRRQMPPAPQANQDKEVRNSRNEGVLR